MPLGLMPGMKYEEKETSLAPGESILLYSDGLVEAHDPERNMFGFPRLQALLADYQGQTDVVDFLLTELSNFTGDGWEQEDDVTLLKIERLPQAESPIETQPNSQQVHDTEWQTLATFTFPSEPGREREVADKVIAVVTDFSDQIAGRRLNRLKTAVAEAARNAMEHGNGYQADLPTSVVVLTNSRSLAIRITDQGSKPITETETPDLEAKLAGLQKPRGWGLFLIQKMVDELNTIQDDHHHTIELILHLEGDASGRENA
jgi:anti-sigma regulatory factor (Ser/Thr protein kinase)